MAGDRSQDWSHASLVFGDERALARARRFVDEALLDRVWLHGALEVEALRKRDDVVALVAAEAPAGQELVGLCARLPGMLAQPLVAAAGRLSGAVAALVSGHERPFVCVVPERHAPELARAGGERLRSELQMARLFASSLPEPDARVERVEDADEIRGFAGLEVPGYQAELGPFFGVRDARGALAALGGVRFVTERVAFVAHVETREDMRRKGLASAVVTALVRALERPGRRVLLQTREDNQPAQALYRGLGFRGSRRMVLFAFS